MRVILVLFVLFQLVMCQNRRPVIGILTQPTSAIPAFVSLGSTFVPSSYVKWLESAGAMVIPVPSDSDEPTLTSVFGTINGLLLTGSDADLANSSYMSSTLTLYKLALKANDAGDVFPIWSTGQGFKELLNITSGGSVLETFQIGDLSVPLQFQTTPKNSQLFSALEFTSDMYFTLTRKSVCQFLHNTSLSPDSFAKDPLLSKFYTVITVNTDRSNKTFISTIEAQKYPIFGTFWHPERNQFEWDGQEQILSDMDTLRCMQYVANVFVDKARASNHVYKMVYYDLIESSPVTYTLDHYHYYVSTYFFE